MIDEICLNPFGAVRPRLSYFLAIGGCRIEQEVVNWSWTQLLKGLLGKCLDGFHVIQLEGQDGDRVLAAVVLEPIVGICSRLDVSDTENKAIGLCLEQQLLDSLEALH